MKLEKIVTDGMTLFFNPNMVKNMTNCVIYLSEKNYNHFLELVYNFQTNRQTPEFIKKEKMQSFKKFIDFGKKNIDVINKDCVQTDELLWDERNNSYIVIVKQVKNIGKTMQLPIKAFLDDYVNDTIYIGLSEEATIVTASRDVIITIKENKLDVATIDLSQKSDIEE